MISDEFWAFCDNNWLVLFEKLNFLTKNEPETIFMDQVIRKKVQ